jgi:arylsulfatase A-like enzyme
MNVAVVVLDTLRKDAFERQFDWLPGRRFDNAWSPSHWTVPVHGSLFTGCYPSETGVHAQNVTLDCDRQVLAEQLSGAGYTTRAFSCNPYVSPVFGYDRGFDEFTGSWRLRQFDPDLFDWNTFISDTDGEGPTRYLRAVYQCLRDDCRTLPSLRQGLKMKLRESDLAGSIDDDGAAEALEYVRETEFGSEEFLYLNLMEAHTPYDPPEEYETVDLTQGGGLAETISGDDSTVDAETVRQAYDDCVRYLSDIYEEMFAVLIDQFDYVITLSDHGELLGEHGGWTHGYGLYRELTNVPLSIYGPDLEDGVTDDLVSLLDIHATVLETAAGEGESSPRGRSLLEGDRTRACLTEYHGFTELKLGRLRNADISAERLDQCDQTLRGIVRSDYYGFETPENFVETGKEPPENGPAALEQRVDELDVRERETGDREVSDSVMSHLEDLGYA